MDLSSMTYWDALILLVRVIWKIALNFWPASLLVLGILLWETWEEIGAKRARELERIRRNSVIVRRFWWQRRVL